MVSSNDNEYSNMLLNICEGMVGQENRHSFVLDLLKSLDKYSTLNRRPVIKRFLMAVLKQFSLSKSRSVHFETFPLWIMLAKYSETMDIKKILDHVSYLYDDYLPYYRVYISELLSINQEAEAKQMLQKCKDKCRLTDQQISEEFPTLHVVKTSTLHSPNSLGKTLISVTMTEPEKTLCSQADQLSLSNNVTKLADHYKQDSGFLGMLIGSLLGAQLAQLLSTSESGCKLSPQSVVISAPLETSLTPDALVDKCVLKFVEPTKGSRLLFEEKGSISGFLNVIGYLLFLDSFNIVKTDEGSVPDKIISRRYVDRNLWIDVFQRLLNGGEHNTIDWSVLASELKTTFVQMAVAKKSLWNQSLHEFNQHFHALIH